MAETAAQTEANPTFEERYYHQLRRRKLAPVIGELALSSNEADNLRRRRLAELTSGLAEAIDGVVRTDWSFEITDGKVMAEDGQAVEDLLRNGLQDAMRIASSNLFYASFLPQRSRHELDELREQQAMAAEITDYNTIITFSPYTEELATTPQNNAKLRRANQKPDWQRAMIRVSRFDGGRLHVSTRSIDNSSLKLLKQTAKNSLGYEFQAKNSTEMLGERIYLNVANNQIADELVNEADSIIAAEKGGAWKQGRQEKTADTQKYVESQQAILEEFFRVDERLAQQHPDFESYKEAFHEQLYNYAALLENRLLSGRPAEQMYDVSAAAEASGAMARAEGKVYDMCGLVLTANGENTSYGAKTGFESLLRLMGKEVECPACKEKVVMPAAKLEKGILCCTACQYEVDACTGEVYKKPQLKTKPQPDLLPKKETDWQRIVREDEQKKAKRKQKRLELERLKKAA